jgi:hypothetical protein
MGSSSTGDAARNPDGSADEAEFHSGNLDPGQSLGGLAPTRIALEAFTPSAENW